MCASCHELHDLWVDVAYIGIALTTAWLLANFWPCNASFKEWNWQWSYALRSSFHVFIQFSAFHKWNVDGHCHAGNCAHRDETSFLSSIPYFNPCQEELPEFCAPYINAKVLKSFICQTAWLSAFSGLFWIIVQCDLKCFHSNFYHLFSSLSQKITFFFWHDVICQLKELSWDWYFLFVRLVYTLLVFRDTRPYSTLLELWSSKQDGT
jgi:uncharacterized protein Usg